MLFSGVILGYVIPRQQRATREKAAIESIAQKSLPYHRPVFSYDYQMDERTGRVGGIHATNPTPKWIQPLLGEHTFSTIVKVHVAPLALIKGNSRNRVDDYADELESLENLETLEVSGWRNDWDNLQPIGKLKRLRNLVLNLGAGLESTEGVEEFESLESLELKGSDVVSAESIASLTGLRRLLLIDCRKLKSLDFLSKLSTLETLKIEKPPKQSSFDIELVSKNRQLQELRLSGFDFLENPQRITDLSELQSLEVLDCQSFDSETLFSNATSVKRLSLVFCHSLQSMSGIESLDKLEIVSVSLCKQLLDLEALASLKGLEQLTLNGLEIERLPRLASLPNLETLEIHGLFNIQNLDELAELNAPKLTIIRISDCLKLKSIDGLTAIKSLKGITFLRCPFVGSEQIQKLKEALPNANVNVL